MALSNINIVETTPGTLTISWVQDTLEGNSSSLLDGEELCKLHFIANGPSTCEFPTPVELLADSTQETKSYPNIIRDVDFLNGSLGFCDPVFVLVASGGTLTEGTPDGGGGSD